jgi:hypothetical protein
LRDWCRHFVAKSVWRAKEEASDSPKIYRTEEIDEINVCNASSSAMCGGVRRDTSSGREPVRDIARLSEGAEELGQCSLNALDGRRRC